MKENKISIVTPSFNSAKFIEDCIQSVLNQNYPNFEHIIIDGGSTDGTIEILKKYPHLKWISEPDEGQSDALNKGFKITNGVLIGWLNADDYYLPNAFNNIIDAFNRIEWADVYYGDYLMVGDNGKVICNMKEIDFNKDVLKYYRCYIASTASFFKKKIFTDNNYLRKDFNLAMDYEFYLRLVKKSYQFYHLPIYLSCFRWHGGNKSLDKKQAIIEHNRILDLYGKRIFKNEKINRIIFIILYQYYRIIRIYYKIILRIKKNKME